MADTENQDQLLQDVTRNEYKYGFVTEVEHDTIPRGLSEDTVRRISALKQEPEWMLRFRLKAYEKWLTMKMPAWAHLTIPEIDYQAIYYYAAPKQKPSL
ncbi:MAG TPA: Fe-S cluster assembly protein SufB, partial [Bacteroidales bacterium]|nr:Fe-S cluster assembly protein SufB [Bacteroidales bacterium]